MYFIIIIFLIHSSSLPLCILIPSLKHFKEIQNHIRSPSVRVTYWTLTVSPVSSYRHSRPKNKQIFKLFIIPVIAIALILI
jgi:hypothetical protein